jgi:[ribosomal protein S5]-alanine N-acetyltransferase
MSLMILLPIMIDERENDRFRNNPECEEVMSVYPDYYKKIGYNEPWIGYFATIDGIEIVGSGGYKGKPANGKIEIAYGTFKKFQRKGIGTQICSELVSLALKTDPSLRITARTLLENNFSSRILKSNGFECLGIVDDEEDGKVWEWEYRFSNQVYNG